MQGSVDGPGLEVADPTSACVLVIRAEVRAAPGPRVQEEEEMLWRVHSPSQHRSIWAADCPLWAKSHQTLVCVNKVLREHRPAVFC